ncbi:MAG TPA: penicillin acylase family protein [Bryobacteraceae bacterium]|nr:penicillin acylase family protein [Bryobacteraceae bacterium]
MERFQINRLVRWVNGAIAICLLLFLVAAYRYAWRPLPQTSGTIRAFIHERVEVRRDTLGVPHIRASSEEDALFAQGYVTAQDRLFQMDSLRRLAGGTLSEVVGPAGLSLDEDSRRLRLRRIAEAAYISMDRRDRAVMAAYARGVNAFLQTHLNRLPLEFTLLRYDPQPWSVVDSILIGLHMFRTLTSSWRLDLEKRSMLAAGDAAKVNYLFSPRAGGDVQPGSNNWVLSGAHTASGKPLLSNDMHLEWSLPSVWYMVHLQAPGLDVAGVSLPGVPAVIVGHNQRIAWGVTNLEYDVQDLYLEQLDDRTGRYRFRGQVEQARGEREIIRVKGTSPTELFTWVTRHGPVLVAEGKDRMALRWAASEPGTVDFPFLGIDKASNWQEFTAALTRFRGPAQNFVYADVDGNIGYRAAGNLPIRRGFSGDVPLDGASGNFEWDGFIPFNDLPSAFNPPSGILVTANQNVFPAHFPYPAYGRFAAPYRARQIRDLLASRQNWRAEDLLAVQKDVYSGFSLFLARALVAAYERRKAHNPSLEEAIALLRSWNGQMEKTQAAPLIVTLTYQHLRRAVADSAAPGKGLIYDYPLSASVIEELLRTRPSGWFTDYDQTLLRCLSDGVEEGKRVYGRKVARWRWGSYLLLTIRNPVLHQMPLIGSYFDIGPVPMSGSTTSVKQTTTRLGPSMRMDADLGDWDRSLLSIPIGQSGQILSPHYRDEWRRYYNGESFPMQYRKIDAKDVLEMLPQLSRKKE